MERRLFWYAWAGIAAFLAGVCLFTVLILQRRFGGYDLSPLIDAGWRVLSGQIPNRDFICTFPPLIYLAAAAAFRVFGVRWIALSLTSALFSFLIALLGMRALLLLRGRFADALLLRLAVTFAVLEMLPLLIVGHPWHSSWTEAAALYAIAATFALIQMPDAPPGAQWELLAHLALAECLLVLAKPNTALPALVACTLALLLSKQPWWKAVLALGLAIGAASLLLLPVHTSLRETWHIYLQLKSRMVPHEFLFGIRILSTGTTFLIAYLPVLPILVWVLAVAAADLFRGRFTSLDLLALGACAVTLAGWGTNSEFKVVDAPCLVLGAILLATSRWEKVRRLESAFFLALYCLLGISFFFSFTRARMQTVGEWGVDGCGFRLKQQNDPFFGQFKNCAPFFSVLGEVDAAVAAHPGARIFFGPRMEFLYAREHVASPEGLPLWWHPGTSFPFSAGPAVLNAWQNDHLDLLIFLHDDRTRVPQPILDLMSRRYTETTVTPKLPAGAEPHSEAGIDIYVPRSAPATSSPQKVSVVQLPGLHPVPLLPN